MEQLERRDKCSNSLLANVLDMDDDFLAGTGSDKVEFGNLDFWAGTGAVKVGFECIAFSREWGSDKVETGTDKAGSGNTFWREPALTRWVYKHRLFGGSRQKIN